MKEKKNYQGITLSIWLLVLILWFAVTKIELIPAVILPAPKEVVLTGIDIIKHGYNNISFWSHLGVSFYRLISATFFAILLGIPLGLLSGYSQKVHAVIDSFVQFYRPIPPLAYYTLLVMWMGIGQASKIMLLFLAAFAPIYISCIAATNKINPNYILSAQTLGANRKQIFKTIILPACLPEIFTGIRTAVGVSYTTLVAAEMVAATSGIGWMVIDASKYLKSNVMFFGIIIMGLTGILIDFGLQKLERKLVFWKGMD